MATALTPLATSLRAMQFYAHAAHNCASGPNFFADHAFFGELYSAYEDAYDATVERIIGLDEELIDFRVITLDAAKAFGNSGFREDSGSTKWFTKLKESEEALCTLLTKSLDGQSEGTKNFLQGLADDAESRLYKISQRIA